MTKYLSSNVQNIKSIINDTCLTRKYWNSTLPNNSLEPSYKLYVLLSIFNFATLVWLWKNYHWPKESQGNRERNKQNFDYEIYKVYPKYLFIEGRRWKLQNKNNFILYTLIHT